MGITVAEFEVAMGIYGARKRHLISKTITDRYDIPCFTVKKVDFFHSGSSYVESLNSSIPKDILNDAMAVFGEKLPGGDNIWFGEIHSLKALFTIVTMIDGNYSKELVDSLINVTYQKLLSSSLITNPSDFPWTDSSYPKIYELCQKVKEYDSIINPFSNRSFAIKEPIEYLDKINLSLSIREGMIPHARFIISAEEAQIVYLNDYYNWLSKSQIYFLENGSRSCCDMGHYYNGDDVVVYIEYTSNDNPAEYIDLRISLVTGLAWATYEPGKAKLATDEQIDTIITHLDKSIQTIKEKIICYMIN